MINAAPVDNVREALGRAEGEISTLEDHADEARRRICEALSLTNEVENGDRSLRALCDVLAEAGVAVDRIGRDVHDAERAITEAADTLNAVAAENPRMTLTAEAWNGLQDVLRHVEATMADASLRDYAVKARVTLTIEIDLDQPWGQDCTCEQVFQQAARSAVDTVKIAFQGKVTPDRWRLVQDPRVTAVLAESKE